MQDNQQESQSLLPYQKLFVTGIEEVKSGKQLCQRTIPVQNNERIDTIFQELIKKIRK